MCRLPKEGTSLDFDTLSLSPHHLPTTMSSSEDRDSWDSVRYSSDPSEMSDEVDAALEEVFERVENALKNQLNHLRSLGEAINAIEREETNAGTVIHRLPLPNNRGAAKLSKREKLWKEGRRDLYRFIEDFEEQISARSFLHLRKIEKRPQRGQSPELRAFPEEKGRGSAIDPVNLDSPLQVPKPTERYGKSGCFAPAPVSRVRTTSPPPRPDPRPPTPPVPERHPSRRTSLIRSPTGSVMLFNTPANFVANMLPEEHVQMAKTKQRESMIRAFDPDLTIRRGSSRTPDSTPISPAGLSNATPARSPHPSRSTSSLKLAAVAEEHSAPAGLIPLILTNSMRKSSRIQRPPPSVPYHATTLSASLASKDFYDPPQEAVPRPTSHLPTVMRSSSGLFTSNPPEPAPEQTPSLSNQSYEAEADELKTTQIQFVREKLTRDRKKAELQWNEANRMLQGLPPLKDEGLPVRPMSRPRPRPERVMSASGEGLESGEESMRTRIKNLWKTGTKKGGLGMSFKGVSRVDERKMRWDGMGWGFAKELKY
jgi:hypothetical protein